uniref:YLP motif-containing protein 1 n=1 Tax=Paramormyrops kingsleyae TaxID=1676925 RepID=A0A3B3QHD8_9TELE|nr:YLP motif-containing protein 1 isoform X1 [Paramormyrops kingsleyae]XP_023668608.1 YLP motif-containing protein 1 isoform X1 [Paramormyrops kingsleyae]
MYPSWGNYGGGHQPPPGPPQHFGMRPPHLRGPPPAGGVFGGYSAPAPAAPASNFSSLREQHLQQMQQLQQLHQKQLQSVLHNNGPYGSNAASGSWQGSGAGYSVSGSSAPSSAYQGQQPPRGPTFPVQQEAQPPPPEPAPSLVHQSGSSTPGNVHESTTQPDPAASARSEKDEKPDFSSMTLQEQQQYWYKQHLQNLQRLKTEKAKQNQNNGESQQTPKNQGSAAPPPPVEPPKSMPPPPPPKEEPPPPPPPEDSKSLVTAPGDPDEVARLQQLQAAAAQWQQAQHQRAGFQYQALMQQHAQLQQILQQYQQFVQQPTHLQNMPVDVQLRHFEMQQQQFGPVYQEWNRQFKLWQDQFQSYPHRDQLQEYEAQWKQWQEQMKSTSVHLQERVTTLRAMQHQYGGAPFGGMMGMPPYGQYRSPSSETRMPPPHPMSTPPPPPVKVEATPPPQCPRPPVPPSIQPPPQGPCPPVPPSIQPAPPPQGPRPLVPPPNQQAPPPQGLRHQVPPPGQQPPPSHGLRPPVPPTSQPALPAQGPPPTGLLPGQSPLPAQGPQQPMPPSSQPSPQGPRQPVLPHSQPAPSPQGPHPQVPLPPSQLAPQGLPSGPRVSPPPGAPEPCPPAPTAHAMSASPSSAAPSAPLEARSSPGPSMQPPRPSGPQARFEGPRGPRFEGPRGNGVLRFEQRFGPSPRFEAHQRFDPPPRGPHAPRFGGPVRFEPPVRQNPPMRFERPPGPPRPPQPQMVEAPVLAGPLSDGAIQAGEARMPRATLPEEPEAAAEEPAATGSLASQELVSDDILDSSDGFFVQSDPIPQTTVKSEPQKKPAQPCEDTGKKEKPALDTGKVSESPTASPAPKAPPITTNSDSFSQGGGPVRGMGLPLKPKGPGPAPPKPDLAKPPPTFPHTDSEMAPPSLGRGRGRGMLPTPGRGRGRGLLMGPPHGFGPGSGQRGEDVEMMHHSYRGKEDAPEWQGTEGGAEVREEDMWEHEDDGHYQEEYYEEPGRRGPLPPSRGRHWDEPQPDYWGPGEPYWAERRPPLRYRPPFPHEEPRRPPPPPHSFLHHGPRRPPPPPHEMMEREARGLPPHRPPMEPPGPPRHREPPPPLPPMHRDMPERDLRRPPPPQREMLEREHRGPPLFHHDPGDREPGWPPRRPLQPHDGMEREQRWHEPLEREECRPEQDYPDEYGPEGEEYQEQDYEPEEGRYGPRGEWDREYHSAYPQYPQRGPPERFRKDQWGGERERPYPFEGEPGERGELRVREYPGESVFRRDGLPPPSYPPPPPPPPSMQTHGWEPPLQDRSFPPDVEQRPQFDGRAEPRLELQHPPPVPGAPGGLSEPSGEPASPGAAKGILALSQRQHEIILKAAQELKMIRELQETKNAMGEFPKPEGVEPKPEMNEGLLGLEIPPEVRSALQATSLLPDSSPAPAAPSWDTGGAAPASEPGFLLSQAPPPAPAKPPVISRTVDYGHGHDAGATVERISYGERIVLRPDPPPLERPYEKEPLGSRDPFERDPYYDRRPDPYMERRDYGRERDPYRDKPPGDYERERYERDRYTRDDSQHSVALEGRLPPGPPPRPGPFRERELREGRGSRDREDHYGRPLYDRPPPYERLADHGPLGYGADRRSYPEDRVPVPPPSLAPPPAAPPRVEKKPETKNVEDILKPPGRENRPERIVIIMRGLPGSGKTHVAKLIRDKEVEFGGAPPRVLGLDDYFMTEVEKTEKDPDSGKRVKKKVLEYEYEPEMEDAYRSSMLKTFRKTLDDGFFPFIIIDAINDRVKYFDQFWSAAKTKGFEVYLAEITADNQMCAKRNVHGRKLKDIAKMASNWEPSPRHMVRLDIRSLLQDAAIEEVEMEDFNPSEEEQKTEPTAAAPEEEDGDLGYIPKSKWEMDTSEAKLDKLDGLVSGGKRKRGYDGVSGMEDFLQLPDDYATRLSEPGKKRVRWADLEEKKDADRKRAIGFVVGQTDWEKITDESGQLAQRALNRTKYF